MSDQSFDWNVRVYYEDTDCAGIVYFANYLKFCERARTEFLRSCGWSQQRMRDELKVVFVVAGAEVSYKRSARLDDELTVKTSLEKVQPASLVMRQNIFRADELLVSSSVRLGFISTENMRPCRLPTALLDQLNSIAQS